MWEVLDVLKRIHRGESCRHVARATGRSRTTIRRYLQTAATLGWSPAACAPDEQLTAEVLTILRPGPKGVVAESAAVLKPYKEQIRPQLMFVPSIMAHVPDSMLLAMVVKHSGECHDSCGIDGECYSLCDNGTRLQLFAFQSSMPASQRAPHRENALQFHTQYTPHPDSQAAVFCRNPTGFDKNPTGFDKNTTEFDNGHLEHARQGDQLSQPGR